MPILVETNELIADAQRTGIRGDFHRVTGGFSAHFTGPLAINLEALLQLGGFEGNGSSVGLDTSGGDIMAYMVHADADYRFDDILWPTLWIDYLSGDPDHTDDDQQTFDVIAGYRHRLYGRADRFIDIPRDTKNGGLIDLAAKNRSRIGSGNLDAEYHYFFLARDNIDGDQGAIGTELDLVYRVPVWDKVDLLVGSSWFLPLGDFRDEVDDQGNLVKTDDVFSYEYIQLDMQLP